MALLTARRRAMLVLAASVVLGHALLLAVLPRALGPGWHGAPTRALQVRQLVQPAVAAADDRAVPMPPSAGRGAVAAAELATPAAAPAGLVVASPKTAPTSAETDADAGADADSADATAAAAEPDPGGISLPVYATRLPPALELVYDMRRGIPGNAQTSTQPSSATLRWRPDGGSYQLDLQGSGRNSLSWASQGLIDSDGIAPGRYTESRRGRPQRAVNFQRDSRRITFSGPQREYPLLPGAQDRLSWMLQLPAVLAANPALAQPGRQVLLFVAGTRGDAEVWAFDVLGLETVDAATGDSLPALHLQRLPRRPYDTAADVWLDPARHHLPVRVLLQLRPGGMATAGGTEFLLRELRLP